MGIRTTEASRVTPGERAIWRKIRLENGATLASPFFCPEYVLAVAAVRDDVEVAVLEGDDVEGFVPFQRTRLNVGVPVGGRLADFSGPVVRHGLAWDPMDIVGECGLAGLYLRNAPASMSPLVPYRRREEASPYIDLDAGFDAYREDLRREGSRFVKEQMRKKRKLEREVAPVRFELHTTELRALDALLAWKSEQRKRTGTVNVLENPWAERLLRHLCAIRTESFSGLLSTLHAGDELVAVRFGIRTPTVLHSLCSAYNPSYRAYSPGLLLLLHVLREAPAQGVRRVDLGRGDEKYKLRAMTGATPVMDAPVVANRGLRLVTDLLYAGRRWADGSAAGAILHGAKRRAQRWRHGVAVALERRSGGRADVEESERAASGRGR